VSHARGVAEPPSFWADPPIARFCPVSPYVYYIQIVNIQRTENKLCVSGMKQNEHILKYEKFMMGIYTTQLQYIWQDYDLVSTSMLSAVVVGVHFIRCITRPPEIFLSLYFGPLTLSILDHIIRHTKRPLWLLLSKKLVETQHLEHRVYWCMSSTVLLKNIRDWTYRSNTVRLIPFKSLWYYHDNRLRQ